MPSPIAHAAMGYLVYRVFRSQMPEEASMCVGPVPRLLVATAGLSLVADLDAVPGVLLGDLSRFHNSFTHSLILGPAVALSVATVIWWRRRSGFKSWFAIALACYELHITMDFFTAGGRGVILAWPFSPDRFEPPVKLFYGLHWSEGLVSRKHVITLATELGFVGALAFIVHFSRAGKLLRVALSRGSIGRRARSGRL